VPGYQKATSLTSVHVCGDRHKTPTDIVPASFACNALCPRRTNILADSIAGEYFIKRDPVDSLLPTTTVTQHTTQILIRCENFSVNICVHNIFAGFGYDDGLDSIAFCLWREAGGVIIHH
jgi:hypothetical protein